MNATPLFIREQTPLTRVYRLFRSLGLRHLIVVNDKCQLTGIVSRKDLTKHRMEQALDGLSHDQRDSINDYIPNSTKQTFPETDSSSDAELMPLYGTTTLVPFGSPPPTSYFNRKRTGTDFSELTEITSYFDNNFEHDV